jgi:hypothetical protein
MKTPLSCISKTNLNRFMRWGFVLALFISTTATAQAATITVNSLLMTVANDALCTLPEAITSANNNAAGTTNCTAGSGTDTINFSTSGTINISSANLTQITSPVIIDGGSVITIDAVNTASRRIFDLSSAATPVTIQNIILTDGLQTDGGCINTAGNIALTLTNVTLDDCHATGSGGAIYFGDNTNPSLTMTNVSLIDNLSDGDGGAIFADDGTDITATNLTATNNQAPNGSGAVIYYNAYQANASNVVITGTSTIENSYSLYGAIYIKDDDGHLITGVTFDSNVGGNAGTFQAGNGGAIQINGVADITISDNNFTTNITNYFGSGGAIEIADAANAIIEDNTFTANESDYGGAIHVAEGTVTIRRNAFLNNEAVDEGGALYLSESGGGGPTVSIVNNTFDGNIANADGGGAIRNRFGDASIYNNTFTNNSTPGNGAVILVDTGSQTEFANNIFEDNTGTGTCAVNAPVSFTNQGFNLFDSATGCDPQGSDFTGTTADLGALSLNGGATVNRYPGVSGDAIDNASSTYAPAEDQREEARPFGSADDIGSVEVTGPPDTTAPIIAQVTPVPTPTNDTTPNYTFSSDEAGTIGYGGDCSSATTAAAIGNNTVTFNALAPGAHSNCTIIVTDAASNVSNTLNVTAFTIDTTAPTLAEVTPVTTPSNDPTPNYTFSSTEAGTISYGGDCSSATTAASSGNNTVTFNALSTGPHSNCTVTVTDAANNASAPLSVTAFTLLPPPNPPIGRILFQNDDFATIHSDSIIINSDDQAAGNIVLKFGATIAQTLTWNTSVSRFDLSSTLDLGGNELTSFRTENATSLPGGGPGLGSGGTGRLIMLTSTDSTAPGCTVISCTVGIYAWSGTTWLPLFKGTAGGNTNDVQYFSSNAYGGEDALEYDASTNQFSIPGISINEDLNLAGDISPAQLTADQNDYNPTGLDAASVVNLNGDASFRSITGLSGGADGRVILLHNVGANTIMLLNQNTGSSAANRFDFAGNDIPLFPDDVLTLQYDATDSRWRSEGPENHVIPPARWGLYHFYNMLGITTNSAISSQVSGTSAANSATAINSVAAHAGVVQHTTGTTATGRAGMLSTNAANILIGNSWYWRYETMIRLTALSSGTQRYTYRAGFIDSPSAESTDGVFFRYIDNVNTGQWQLVCRSNGTETATNSTVAPAAATWYRLTIIINPAGTSAEFFVNGTSIGTCASNLPTGAGRGTGFGSLIIKSVGTTASTIDLDYLELIAYANTI